MHARLALLGVRALRTSVACVVRLVPYSSSVGILLLLLPLPPPTLTVSWLSPTMRMTCGAHRATRHADDRGALPADAAEELPQVSFNIDTYWYTVNRHALHAQYINIDCTLTARHTGTTEQDAAKEHVKRVIQTMDAQSTRISPRTRLCTPPASGSWRGLRPGSPEPWLPRPPLPATAPGECARCRCSCALMITGSQRPRVRHVSASLRATRCNSDGDQGFACYTSASLAILCRGWHEQPDSERACDGLQLLT